MTTDIEALKRFVLVRGWTDNAVFTGNIRDATEYLKNNGYHYYETGYNFFPIIAGNVFSPKELNISQFKRLFGGEELPLFRGEKFYDGEYLKIRRSELTDEFFQYYAF